MTHPPAPGHGRAQGAHRGDQRDTDCRARPRHQRHPAPDRRLHQRRDPPNEEALWRGRRDGQDSADERDGRAQAELGAARGDQEPRSRRPDCGPRTCPRSTAAWASTSSHLAYMYEILAYAVGAGSLFGIAAPNSGNASILVKYGTEEQKRKWLLPLIEGTMESGFSMTEPEVSRLRSALHPDRSHARRRRVGHQRAQVVHLERHRRRLLHRDVPGQRSDRRARPAGRMTQIIVPTDTPGVNIVRGIGIFGHCDLRPLRDPLRERAGADREHARTGRPGPRRRPRTGWARGACTTA